MHTQILVVGLGLAGTWVSYWLHLAGIPFVVAEADLPGAATPVASGVINPVTGRRLSTTWMAEELLPFAAEAYTDLGSLLGISLINPTRIIDCFGSPDKRLAFKQRAEEGSPFLHWPHDENDLLAWFRYHLGYGSVSPAYRVDLQAMLTGWKQWLSHNDKLLAPEASQQEVRNLPNGSMQWGEIVCERIIFCNGHRAAESGIFEGLPFAINKGEALLIEMEGAPPPHAIYKKGNTLLPWTDGIWWAGSTYDNNYTNAAPTSAFRTAMESWLRSFLRVPFRVVDHVAALRPATVERRPFVGWHPNRPEVGILNGLGTKGVSLAPYFALQLANSIADKGNILAEADVKRFSGLLGRYVKLK